MPKALCLISLVASILIVVLFLADLAMGMLGMTDIAPLRSANKMMDLTFIPVALVPLLIHGGSHGWQVS